MEKLSRDEITERLAALSGWQFEDKAISKTYVAGSFREAVALVVQTAFLAEAADHHPDILIRYDKVTVLLSTHSAGGVTEKDFVLAGRIDGAFEG